MCETILILKRTTNLYDITFVTQNFRSYNYLLVNFLRMSILSGLSIFPLPVLVPHELSSIPADAIDRSYV